MLRKILSFHPFRCSAAARQSAGECTQQPRASFADRQSSADPAADVERQTRERETEAGRQDREAQAKIAKATTDRQAAALRKAAGEIFVRAFPDRGARYFTEGLTFQEATKEEIAFLATTMGPAVAKLMVANRLKAAGIDDK